MGKENADNRRSIWARYSLWLAITLCSIFLLVPTEVKAANTTIGVQVCNTAVGAPTLLSPSANATTQASSIVLSGTGTPSTAIYAFRNSTQVGFVTSAGDGAFSISVALAIGSNVLKVAVLDECNEYVDSTSVTITRETAPTPPPPSSTGDDSGTASGGSGTSSDDSFQLTGGESSSSDTDSITPKDKASDSTPLVNFPRDGDKFNNRFVVVTGTTTPNTRVKIYLNGKLVAQVLADDQGQFSASVYLRDDKNELYVTTGSGKNLRKSSVITTYFQPDIFSIISSWNIWIWLMIVLTISTFLFLLYFVIRRNKKHNQSDNL